MKLYVFNPDADMALADGKENYIAPASARLMARDLALLPLWYAGVGDGVLAPSAYNEAFLQRMSDLCGLDVRLVTEPEITDYANAWPFPWGWSPSLRRYLLQRGVSPDRLPPVSMWQSYRRMASRERVAELLEVFREMPACCGESHNLRGLAECRAYVERLGRSVLKAPWSGSGKGLCWCEERFTEAIAGWCARVLREQGCVAASPVYDKVADFAMEFFSDGHGGISFQGYSLFRTNKRGAYLGNALLSDGQAAGCLNRFFPLETLFRTGEVLKALLSRHFFAYAGPLGVDMMVCRSGEGFLLHPCVEINLRMNMGILAAHLQRRLLAPGTIGSFSVECYPSPEALYARHAEDEACFPAVVSGGRLVSGYFPLVPLTPSARYRAFVMAAPDTGRSRCHTGLWP